MIKNTIVLITLLLGLGLHANEQEALTKNALTIGTYNIRMFGMNSRETNPGKLIAQLKKIDYDILAVQEIVDKDLFKKTIRKVSRKLRVRLSKCGGSGRQYLGFIYNPKTVRLISTKEDERLNPGKTCKQGLRPAFIGRFEDLKTKEIIRVIAVHLKARPDADSVKMRKLQHKIINTIVSEIKRRGDKNIIVLGDFNTTDYYANAFTERVDSSNFQKFLKKHRLKHLNKELRCSSYWHGENTNDDIVEPSLLDHVVMTPEMSKSFARVSDSKVRSHCKMVKCREVYEEELGSSFEEISDHCPVLTDFHYK